MAGSLSGVSRQDADGWFLEKFRGLSKTYSLSISLYV